MSDGERDRLCRDLRADALAAARRRVVAGRVAVGLVVPVLLAVWWVAAGDGTPPRAPAVGVELPPVPPPAASSPPSAEDDEELLDLLADAGPIIVTLPDGRKVMHLTRN